MVCTDAAARGIDIPDITHVVQSTFAASAIDFLHRVRPWEKHLSGLAEICTEYHLLPIGLTCPFCLPPQLLLAIAGRQKTQS